MRIVSLSPSTTETIFALGADDQLVGVTAFCDYPPEAKQKPTVGGWSTADLTKVYAAKPDLVLTSTIVQNQAAEKFKNFPFRHVHFDPRSLEDILESILTIGQLTNCQAEASLIIKKMRDQVETIGRRQLAVVGKRVYAEEWPKPPMIAGNWVPELVNLAGGQYGIIKQGEPSRLVESQEVIDFDPEIIILNYCGFGNRANVQAVLDRPGWQSISAIKNNNIHVLDDTFLNRPGPRIVEGLKALSTIISKS